MLFVSLGRWPFSVGISLLMLSTPFGPPPQLRCLFFARSGEGRCDQKSRGRAKAHCGAVGTRARFDKQMKSDSDREVVVFTEALRLPAHERSAFLERACAG